MKNFVFKPVVAVPLMLLWLFSCSQEFNQLTPVKPFRTENLFSLAQVGTANASAFNYDVHGQFLYRHLKYYSGTIDPISYIPKEQADAFRTKFNEYQNKVKSNKWTHDQIIDDWVSQNVYSIRQGQIIKDHQNALVQFINNQPDSKTAWNWFSQKEQQIKDDKELSNLEKSEVLNQRAAVKYALLWRLENRPIQVSENRLIQSNANARDDSSCDFWQTLACYVGNVSGLSGSGGPIGGSVALGPAGDPLARATAIGALVGVAIGIIESVNGCQCNTNICDAPLTATYPFECYIPGNSLLVTAVGYGNIRPQSFDFNFSYNDDENNHLYQNTAPSGNDYIYIPGENIVNSGATDFAVKINSHCASNGTTPQQDIPSNLIGWINLNDLGKPFFDIYGADNLTVSDASNHPFNYQINGAVDKTQASILWELIPSGYPNYSATGTLSSNTDYTTVVRWDAHAGYATLKVTTTTHCNANGQDYSVVNYLNVHIQ